MSTAQLNPEQQAIVRKSLVDRLDAKTRLIRFFDLNARTKHGVPLDNCETPAPIVIEKEVEKVVEKPVERVIHEHVDNRQTTVPSNTDSSNINRSSDANNSSLLRNIAIAAVLIGTGAVGTALIMQGFKTEEPTIQMSPLQYLEDQGEHLP